VFLTGAAGTGKSFLLSRFLKGKASDDVPVVASTGAAAVIVGGRTFHSFFGLGILEGGAQATISRALRTRRVLTRLQRAQAVIIDEVSMLSGLTLAVAEEITRKARNNDEPWGGLRIITVGDFAQLPPIAPGFIEKDWAFRHQVWRSSDFQPALLSTVMRTQDTAFLDILNDIRDGKVTNRVQEFLQERCTDASDATEGTRLYPHRAQADVFNVHRLESLPAKLYEFQTEYEGNERYMMSAKKALPIPDVLRVKEGALVMMRKNDVTYPQRFVNGSLGYVRRISEESLMVHLFTGECIDVGKEKFSALDGDGKEVVAAWNFPVSLAWATTIHKAQGASLDTMIVDLHALWEPGQAYTALSRVRSGNGLHILRWSPESIRAEPLVTAFYDALAEATKKYIPRPLLPVVPEATNKVSEAHPKRPIKKNSMSREHRSTMIYRLVEKKTPIDAIALECGVKVDRVILYLEKLLLEGIPLDIEYILKDLPDADRARSAFEDLGIDLLKPVFTALGETVPYDSLRMVRCVMMAETK
jgi:hypothetical protein